MTNETETTRTGTDVARWLLPLLKEYTDKLNGVCDRLAQLLGKSSAIEAILIARVLSSRATYHSVLLRYARQASSLLDHFQFDSDEELELELTHRWQEAEMALRVNDMLDKVVTRMLGRDDGKRIEQLIDHIQTGAILN